VASIAYGPLNIEHGLLGDILLGLAVFGDFVLFYFILKFVSRRFPQSKPGLWRKSHQTVPVSSTESNLSEAYSVLV